jgi:hypothetical protein
LVVLFVAKAVKPAAQREQLPAAMRVMTGATRYSIGRNQHDKQKAKTSSLTDQYHELQNLHPPLFLSFPA